MGTLTHVHPCPLYPPCIYDELKKRLVAAPPFKPRPPRTRISKLSERCSSTSGEDKVLRNIVTSAGVRGLRPRRSNYVPYCRYTTEKTWSKSIESRELHTVFFPVVLRRKNVAARHTKLKVVYHISDSASGRFFSHLYLSG